MISQEMNLKEQIHHHLFSDIVNGVYTQEAFFTKRT